MCASAHARIARAIRNARRAAGRCAGTQLRSSVTDAVQPPAPDSWLSLCAGLPVIAGATPGAGRGLFAVVDVPYASTLFRAEPVVCCPPSSSNGTASLRTCAYCLRPLASPEKHQFCSVQCLEHSKRVLPQSVTPKWTRFYDDCATRGVVYPLLAARLALGVVHGVFHPKVLQPLCYARGAVTQPPAPWIEEHALLLGALLESKHDASWLTVEWYASVLARLHINAFRVDIPRLDMPLTLDALAQQSQHGSGTAVYMLPSLLNHSCEPNVDALWRDGDATLTLAARRDIAAGEELSITYIDADLPVAERRQMLHHGYGFNCRCPACLDEAGDK